MTLKKKVHTVRVMDWKTIVTTVITIFLAELGDKTQLAALGLGAKTNTIYSVWLGVVLGLILAGSLGVWVGHLSVRLIQPKYLSIGAGFLFIILGILTLKEAWFSTGD